MKGTAILFHEKRITFIEDVDLSVYKEIKDQCGCDQCSCKLKDKVVSFGSVSPVIWHEDEVDWDYGY
jgi:hypothetical protein